jgi:hypothetical protein
MARRSFVQIGGKLYERGVDIIPEQAAGRDGLGNGSHAVMGDIPDFVSPIDGSVVRGRAGMREHCRRHHVVPTAELAGLPPKTMQHNGAPSEAYRQQTRQTIADVINSRSDLWRKFKG